MNIDEYIDNLIEVSHNDAIRRGFHDEVHSVHRMTLLLNSEIYEAFEDIRDGVKDGYTDNGWISFGDEEPGYGTEIVTYNRNTKDIVRHTSNYIGQAYTGSIYWKPLNPPTGNKKPIGFESEVADVGIRLADCLGVDELSKVENDTDVEFLFRVQYEISEAGIDFLHSCITFEVYKYRLGGILEELFERYKWIPAKIDEKLAYNRTRGYKHGKRY